MRDSIVIPLEQGLRQHYTPNIVLGLTWFYCHSIRTRIKTFFSYRYRKGCNYSIVIPLEQGLRHDRAYKSCTSRWNSIVIPLEQGLRPTQEWFPFLPVQFYCHSIRTRIKTLTSGRNSLLEKFYCHSIRTRIKTPHLLRHSECRRILLSFH